MYCSACKVQFPDNLNFCKQCGRPLVVQPEHSATLSKCCTRCGARVVAAENFCQQCGARAKTKSQDTTIGACQQCSTPWRSAWLYCRNCGLDRDRALELVSMPALPDQSTPTLTTEVVSIRSQPDDASPHCPRCGADATPYAQFCDVCGQSLTSSEIEPFEIETDEEVDHQTLEVPVPLVAAVPSANGLDGEESPALPMGVQAHEPVEVPPAAEAEEKELDPSRTTERVLALQQSQAPDTSPINKTGAAGDIGGPGHNAPNQEEAPGAYSTQESKPVTITELYYGDDFRHPPPVTPDKEIERPAQDEKATESRTTSFDPRRATADVRMTVESRVISTHQIRDTSEEDVDLDEEVPPEPTPPRPVGSASLAGTPDRARRAYWQAGAIILCLLVLFVLIAIIAVQEYSKRSREAEATAPAVPAKTTESAIPDGMVQIPGGTFLMGREGGDTFERPAHSVTVAPFLIDRTEVTNEQYQKFITETRRHAPTHWQDGKFPADESTFPVINVSWQDATDYARWAGKRLPTEAEWEFAARGTDERIYPWGSKFENGRANARGAAGRIVSVGSFPEGASPFAVLDLSGNVWEWTADELTSYAEGNRILAPGRVIRGGAFDVPPNRATATYRGVVQPERTYDKTGFRCVK